jgi:hypothetical protein
MIQPKALAVQLDDLIALTKKGTQEWDVTVQTTEHMEDSLKDHIEEDGKVWTIDECYTNFTCKYLGSPFHLISYELLKTSGDEVKSNNLLFMAPDAMRIFQLDYLAPFNVQNSPVLTEKLHTLWLLILEGVKSGNKKIRLDASEPPLSAMPSQNPEDQIISEID